MLDKRKISRNSETDRYIQLANDFIVLAEKELSAFIRSLHRHSSGHRLTQKPVQMVCSFLAWQI